MTDENWATLGDSRQFRDAVAGTGDRRAGRWSTPLAQTCLAHPLRRLPVPPSATPSIVGVAGHICVDWVGLLEPLGARIMRRVLLAVVVAVLALGSPGQAQPLKSADGRSIQLSEPVRLCGTNSSRSRRCNFGFRDCVQAGTAAKECERALGICRSCIDVIVACMRTTGTSCATCTQRYDACMQPWVDIMTQ